MLHDFQIDLIRLVYIAGSKKSFYRGFQPYRQSGTISLLLIEDGAIVFLFDEKSILAPSILILLLFAAAAAVVHPQHPRPPITQHIRFAWEGNHNRYDEDVMERSSVATALSVF